MIQSKITKHLPEPDIIAQTYSQNLLDVIRAEITKLGPITFARYMELALYTPGLGYYSAGAQKLGVCGDFVTAPEISSLFSRSLARQCQQILQSLEKGDVLELGAGSGIMAADLLLELEKLAALPEHYYILEISADLKQRQQQLLKEKIPQLFDRIVWLDSLPLFKISGIILANEVLDAMPVHKFKIQEQTIQEFYIGLKNTELQWQLGLPSINLERQVQALNITATEDYESEINLALPSWLTAINNVLQQGVMLFGDYGFSRKEYYHPDRSMGTIMCHYRHRAHPDPLLFPGLQDITSHVDFTAVAEAADSNFLTVAGYTTQANFLLSCGITDLVQTADPILQMKLNQEFKKLVLPSEMGEIFKVMALTRDFVWPLRGFQLSDIRHKL